MRLQNPGWEVCAWCREDLYPISALEVVDLTSSPPLQLPTRPLPSPPPPPPALTAPAQSAVMSSFSTASQARIKNIAYTHKAKAIPTVQVVLSLTMVKVYYQNANGLLVKVNEKAFKSVRYSQQPLLLSVAYKDHIGLVNYVLGAFVPTQDKLRQLQWRFVQSATSGPGWQVTEIGGDISAIASVRQLLDALSLDHSKGPHVLHMVCDIEPAPSTPVGKQATENCKEDLEPDMLSTPSRVSRGGSRGRRGRGGGRGSRDTIREGNKRIKQDVPTMEEVVVAIKPEVQGRGKVKKEVPLQAKAKGQTVAKLEPGIKGEHESESGELSDDLLEAPWRHQAGTGGGSCLLAAGFTMETRLVLRKREWAATIEEDAN